MDSNCSPCQCSEPEAVRALVLEAGAFRVGFAAAHPVATPVADAYDAWIAEGCHGYMEYLARYPEVRRHPAMLLPGAATVISCAFPYPADGGSPVIASYAQGEDYHTAIKRRLLPVAEAISNRWGGQTRVCVDTAPIPERYWAVRAGLGFIGLNRQLIIPGAGSRFHLAEIIWTVPLTPDEPCTLSCNGCMACIHACPGGALAPGRFDARRCVSYLTIEHRGPFPPSYRSGGMVYGCDRCQQVCPHNAVSAPTPLPELHPRPAIAALTPEAVAAISPAQYRHLFAGTAMRRARLDMLRRNALELLATSRPSPDVMPIYMAKKSN